MRTHLLVGPNPIGGSKWLSFAAVEFRESVIFLGRDLYYCHHGNRNGWSRHRGRNLTASSSPPTAASGQNHYAVLGVSRSATSTDIKRAYRLLARKFHPDVSKHARAGELFKIIRQAYEVLSDEATRNQYDQALESLEGTRLYRTARSHNPEFEDGTQSYEWAEMRWRMQHERYNRYYNAYVKRDFNESDEETDEETTSEERGPFTEVLRSAFLSLLLLKTFGSCVALTFSGLIAMLDKDLDAGYKIGYTIAWILGGTGGVLLTLCLSFASWVCGKASSSLVVLVVVAMWVGSNLARYAPLPQGALLTLLYMTIRLKN